jgi:hypothetical protein
MSGNDHQPIRRGPRRRERHPRRFKGLLERCSACPVRITEQMRPVSIRNFEGTSGSARFPSRREMSYQSLPGCALGFNISTWAIRRRSTHGGRPVKQIVYQRGKRLRWDVVRRGQRARLVEPRRAKQLRANHVLTMPPLACRRMPPFRAAQTQSPPRDRHERCAA